jgi:hypothetical protein
MSATNCRCVGRIEAQFAKNTPEAFEAAVQEVDLLTERTFSTIEWKTVNKKRKHIILAHTYCPFCGKKYKCRCAAEQEERKIKELLALDAALPTEYERKSEP